MIKEAFDVLRHSILVIINNSLLTGIVPKHFKYALVQPLLKKTHLDPAVVSNYRPISKLPFLSKVLEKVVLNQIHSFLIQNDIFEVFQSGFRAFHSTESALIRVLNDLLTAVDSGSSAVLVLLDLCAAFDTIDHDILLSRLENVIGIQGTALAWFKSFLLNRTFSVNIGRDRSQPASQLSGVPQGSILGQILFSLYLLPLGSIFSKHGLPFHFYGDVQIYLPLEKEQQIGLLRNCIHDIKSWLSLNFLKLNEEKTEVV